MQASTVIYTHPIVQTPESIYYWMPCYRSAPDQSDCMSLPPRPTALLRRPAAFGLRRAFGLLAALVFGDPALGHRRVLAEEEVLHLLHQKFLRSRVGEFQAIMVDEQGGLLL